ncbi:flippase-like domain-containing protein [Candidatus Desantisbacteria bacterium]|nr:flippase-like domain-containing protein [Candidatus Desantisbacteria bacterium]
MKKNIKLLLGIVISGFFLYLAFSNVDFAKILDIIKNVDYYYIIILTIILFASNIIRAVRWKYLLKPLKEIKMWTLFKIIMIGFMANNILPFRMAEFVRAYVLGQKENISKTSSFATIVLERFFDLLGILTISSIFFIFAPVPDYLKNTGFILMMIAICFISFLIFIKYKQEVIHKIINKLLTKFAEKHVHKAAEFINSFTAGLEAFTNIGDVLMILFLSVGVWLAAFLCYYYTALMFNLNIPFWKNFFPFLTSIIGVMIPSAPGFVGTFHEFCRRGLILAGVTDNNVAVSYAILIHAIQYIEITVLGIYFLWQEGISLFKINENEI